MADRHFVGGNGTTSAGTAWNNTASWSATQGGATGASIPIAGDSIYLNKNKSAIAYLNVATTSIANGTASAPFTALYVSKGLGTNGVYVIAGTNQSTAGVAWSLTNPITIDTAQSDSTLTFRNNITGGGTITKTGPGGFGTDTIAATTWGTSPINLQEGYLFFNGANNKFGTGKITMSGGTHLFSNAANGTTYTLANPLDIRGNVNLNINSLAGRGQITFTAAVDLDSSTRTLNVGGTLTTRFTSNIVFTGVVSGTAGFNLTGGGLFGLTNTGNTLSGAISLTGAYLLPGSTAIPPTSSGNTIPSITDISIDATSYVSVRSNAAFTIPYNITGSGFFQGYVTAAGGLTIPSTKTGGFTGQIQNYTDSTSSSYINIDKLYPLNYALYGSSSKAYITYTGSATESMPANIEIYAPTTATGNPTAIFVHNGSSGSVLTLGTAISCIGPGTITQTFELSGSNSDDNIVSGIISNGTSTALGLNKSGVGKWILSAANTHTGSTSLTGGTLVVANQNALQNSTLTWQTAGTTLTIDPSLTATTFGGLSGTAAGLTLTIPSGNTLTVGGNNSSTTFANAVSGPGNFTKTGSGTLALTGSLSGLSSTVNLNLGGLYLESPSYGAMTISNPTAATSGNRLSRFVSLSPFATNGYSFPAGFVLTGDGVFYTGCANITTLTTGITFPSGSLSGLTGTAAGSTSNPCSGLSLYTASSSAAARTGIFNINEFPGGGSPGVLTYEFNYDLTNIALSNSLYYINSGSSHSYPTRIDINNYSGGTAAIGTGSMTANLYANQGTGSLVLSGGIVRYGLVGATSYTATLNLRGTSAADNEISGSITQSSGVLAIQKSDAGKWILSGSGNHTGNTTLSGGELVIKNTNAVQNSTVVWQTAGTTLTIDPSLTSVNFGGLSGTAAGLTLTIPSGDTLTVGGNNSTTTFANAISGPGNFTKAGTGVLTLSGSLSGFSSTMTMSAGGLTLDSASFGAMTIDHTTVGVRASKYVNIRPTVTGGYSFPAGFNLTGLGLVLANTLNITSQTTGLTFPAGALAGLTGTTAGATTGAVTGLATYCSALNATQRTPIINVVDLPRVYTFEFDFNTTGQNLVSTLDYAAAGSSHTYATRIDIINLNGASAIGSNTQTANLYANQSTGPLILTGGIVRYSSTATYNVTLNLRGTSTADNEISGNITQSSGILSIQKSDAGRWKLTGANSFTGAVTVSAGTLYCNNGSAGATSSLGSSAATGAVTLAGGTLELDGCDSLRTSSAMTVSANSNVTALSGTNGIRVSGTTINNGISLTTDVADGATMLYSGTFTYGGSDSPNRFVKTGLGTLRLTSTTSTWANAGWLFTNGTVEFANIANSGGSSFGNSGSLTFRGNITVNHTGTAASTTTRSLTLGDATVACTNFVLNTNGVGGSLTFNSSSLNIGSTASSMSLTLGGTNSGSNSADWSIADSSGGGVVSLTKSGSCNWTLTGSLTYTGITTCSGTGTLNLGSTNRILSGGLNISGGTVAITAGNTVNTNTIMSGGTISAKLVGSSNTLGIQSGASEASPATIFCNDPSDGNNTFTGDTTINGCVDIETPTSLDISSSGKGRVLGENNTVTIGSNGIIRTKGGTSTVQDGRARYYNLTLGNGAKLKIGFAA